MSKERTLSIIKPDGVRKNITGKIITMFESANLRIVAQKRVVLTESQVAIFYKDHESKSYFKDLVNYMISGPVILQILEGENAIIRNREIMGATNPKDAKDGTIRKQFASSIEENVVHGSDSQENAKFEISLFFAQIEIVG